MDQGELKYTKHAQRSELVANYNLKINPNKIDKKEIIYKGGLL